MGKIKLKESEFSNIPEGELIVKVTNIDDTNFDDFDKLSITVADVNGNSARLNFNFTKDDGSPNDMATTVFTIMCRILMDDPDLDEVDYDEILGKFALVEVKHTEGDRGGKFANVKKWIEAKSGFGVAKTETESAPKKKTAAEIIAEARAKRK